MTRSATSADTPTDDELVLLDGEPRRFSFWGWRNVDVIVWWAQADAAAVARLGQLTAQRRVQYPRGVSDIHVVKGNIGLPDAQTRQGLVQLMREVAPYMAALAVVVGGDGFWASTMRSLITGMRVLAPRSYDMRLHGKLSDVISWLPEVHARRTGVTLDPQALLAVLVRADQQWATP